MEGDIRPLDMWLIEGTEVGEQNRPEHRTELEQYERAKDPTLV